MKDFAKKMILHSLIIAASIAVIPFGAGKLASADFSEKEKEAPEKVALKQPVDSALLESMSVLHGSIWDVVDIPEEIQQRVDEDKLTDPLEQSAVEGALPYPENIEDNDGEIRRVTYTTYDGWQFIDLDYGQIRNCTSLGIDEIKSISQTKPDIKLYDLSLPQVLIMHTHTTESYEPYQRDFFDESFCSRTTDTAKSVVAVGEIIAQKLNDAGIGCIHDTTVHDYPDYNGSYQRSAMTVEEILKENPSIKIVLDIHRDALITTDGVRLAPTTEQNGKNAAQIMIISGADDGTMDMPDFRENLKLASLIQNTAESMYPTFTRPILFDYRHYNQDLTTGSLLIEVGSHANSIDEALYAAELLGDVLAEAFENLK